MQLAFEVPTGTVPRRVKIERDRRVFKQQNIGELLLRSHGITAADILPCGDVKRAPAAKSGKGIVSSETCVVPWVSGSTCWQTLLPFFFSFLLFNVVDHSFVGFLCSSLKLWSCPRTVEPLVKNAKIAMPPTVTDAPTMETTFYLPRLYIY